MTELLHFGGLGEVLPSGGAVGLAFEECRAHREKGGPGRGGAENCKSTSAQTPAGSVRALIDKQFPGNTIRYVKGI